MAKFQKFTVIEAESMVHADARAVVKEYARMRDIARKRMNRLKDDDFDWTKASKEKFPAFSNMDVRDLPKAFSELSKFLSAKRSTLGGQKEIRDKTMYTLNKAIGKIYTDEETGEEKVDKSVHGVTKKNYSRVIKIMNETRRMKLNSSLYDSTKIVELADSTLAMSDTAFNDLLDNLEFAIRNRQGFTRIPELDGKSFDEIKSMIEGKKK